jgi:chromosome partitioning protein
MMTIGFFNNKGGVGKTSLVYHVAWMLARHGVRVLAVDLDPQANLTSMFLPEERLEEIWAPSTRPTLHGAVWPLFRGTGDVEPPAIEAIESGLGLLVGDLELSRVEDKLSLAWPQCQNGDEASFRMISAFARATRMAGDRFEAAAALVDVGPNLGALNRAALLSCDFVVVPLGADLFSLQGLRNMGPALRDWRRTWAEMRAKNPDPTLILPAGAMRPIGYVVMRHSVTAGRPALAFSKWIARIPDDYRRYLLDGQGDVAANDDADPNCIAVLKDYRSLMPLAQEARKPMFLLRPGDGAFGGHQQAVISCYRDFRSLTASIMQRGGLGADLPIG